MTDDDRARVDFEEGSGNVFADLGIEDADGCLARAKIGFSVHQIVRDERLTRREVAARLGISRPDATHLMNGHFSRFTTDALLEFLKRLGRKVTIRITPRAAGEPDQDVGFGP